MLFSDKKKMAGIIVAKLGKPGSHEQKPEEALGDDEAGYQSAAEDILQALSDKSPSGLVEALKAFLGCYEAREEKSETDDSGDDGEWGE